MQNPKNPQPKPADQPHDFVSQMREDIRKGLEELDKKSGPKFSAFDTIRIQNQKRSGTPKR